MLAQGLLGYLPSNVDGAGPPNDGAYGFRTRAVRTLVGGGKVYGPYVTADPKQIKQSTVNALPNDQSFIDPWGHEILYYRSTRSPQAAPPGTTYPPATSIFGSLPNCIFVNNDCSMCATPPAGRPPPTMNPDPNSTGAAFFKLLGAPQSSAGTFTVSSSMLGADSFILISAGDDGVYFTNPVGDPKGLCDDVVMGKD
jgi:hypothetical protein